MKSNSRKKILLVSALLFFLAFIAIASAALIISENKKTFPSVSSNNNLPNDNSNLTKTKTETTAFLEQKLSSDNIKNEILLQELKSENILKAGESNLREYIEGANTPAELEIRKNKVLAIMEKLVKKVPTNFPIQIPPSSPGNDKPNSPDQTENNKNNNNQNPEPNNQPERNKNPPPANKPPTNK